MIIGGYTRETWNEDGYKNDDQAFILNLLARKMYAINYSKAIYARFGYFSDFSSGDISIYKGNQMAKILNYHSI